VKFEDEPVPGYPLPIRPGHTSPGRFERVLRAGAFAVTAELAPPDSADPEDVYRRARVFEGYVDAINATDGSGANCHMSSLAVCALLTRIGHAPVMQISCRDRNRIAIQGDILGGAAMGVCNMLCLTGDGVQAGDHPQAMPVFDLDAISLLNIACNLRDHHRFESGRKISYARGYCSGRRRIRPRRRPQHRALRLAKKVAAGAQFVQTQYCFDLERLRVFMRAVEDLGVLERAFILVGGRPAALGEGRGVDAHARAGHARAGRDHRALASAGDQAREGRNLCVELIQELHTIKGVSGVHVMAYRQEESVAEVIERSGVLGGRRPWRPEAPPFGSLDRKTS